MGEVQRRIDTCWRPYHAALQQACDRAVARWGSCWHLDLHSMPSNAYERLGLPGHRKLADFVLGDLDGRSCDASFRDGVSQVMREHGYEVSVNDPYEGQELVRLHGRPAERRHSLQIEVNRALYMDEATREPHEGFERLRAGGSPAAGTMADQSGACTPAYSAPKPCRPSSAWAWPRRPCAASRRRP